MRRMIVPVIGMIVFLLNACESYIIEKPDIPVDISFSTQIQPIFDNSCVSCHGGGISPDLRPEFSYDELIDGDYVDIADPESSELYTKLRGSHDSRATEAEKLLILQWITEGALNN